MTHVLARLTDVENRIHYLLVRHSLRILRVALGGIFLGFGVLKFFPGVSPAENLVEATTDLLFLGLVPASVAIKLVATLECTIGIFLLLGRPLRLTAWLLVAQLVGILAPLVLLPERLFAGPHHAPTLEGQYVLKDLVLVAAAFVLAAGSFRGGRLVRADLPPVAREPKAPVQTAEEQVQIVFAGMRDPASIKAVCARAQVSEEQYWAWRDIYVLGATQALRRQSVEAPPAAVRQT